MDEIKKHIKSNPSTIATFIILGIFTISILTAIYFYSQYRSLQKKLANPVGVVGSELTALLEKVNKIIDLPTGERPELATISNKNELTQPFFAKAQTGDKVLVYKEAKIAYLYRPSTNKIINVGPVNVATPTPTTGTILTSPAIQTTTTPTPSTTPTPTRTPSPTPEA